MIAPGVIVPLTSRRPTVTPTTTTNTNTTAVNYAFHLSTISQKHFIIITHWHGDELRQTQKMSKLCDFQIVLGVFSCKHFAQKQMIIIWVTCEIIGLPLVFIEKERNIFRFLVWSCIDLFLYYWVTSGHLVSVVARPSWEICELITMVFLIWRQIVTNSQTDV